MQTCDWPHQPELIGSVYSPDPAAANQEAELEKLSQSDSRELEQGAQELQALRREAAELMQEERPWSEESGDQPAGEMAVLIVPEPGGGESGRRNGAPATGAASHSWPRIQPNPSR